MNRTANLTFFVGITTALFFLIFLILTQNGCGSGGSGSSGAQAQTSSGTSSGQTGGGGTTAAGTPTGGTTTASGTAANGGSTTTTSSTTPTGTGMGSGTIQEIQNVIFMLQENRSFDSYFGMLAAYQKTIKGIASPQVEALPLNITLKDNAGNPIHPFHMTTACEDALTPAWGASITQFDNGKMDGFMWTLPLRPDDINGTRAMGYYDWTDLPYYYELVTQYATSDRQFASVGARTPVNRMYIMGASSYGNVDFGPVPKSAPTIFDRLTAAGISWKYYYIPTIPEGGLNITAFNVSQTNPSQIVTTDEYFKDLENGTLPTVSFIESDDSGYDEHPTNNIQVGALEASKFINAFIDSSYYPVGAFFLSYDEHGGLYDHVPPFTVVAPDDYAPKLSEDPGAAHTGSFTRSGFRVPLMVVSPWVKAGYVSHVPRENTSLLKFIEVRFNLPPLTRRDATQDDMTEMFDFTTPALLTPPPLPTQPTNLACADLLEVSPMEP